MQFAELQPPLNWIQSFAQRMSYFRFQPYLLDLRVLKGMTTTDEAL